MDFNLSDEERAVVSSIDGLSVADDVWDELVVGGWLEVARSELALAGLIAERLGLAGVALPYVASGVVWPLLFDSTEHPGRVGVAVDGICEDGFDAQVVLVIDGETATAHDQFELDPVAVLERDGLARVVDVGPAVMSTHGRERVSEVRLAAAAVCAAEMAGHLQRLADLTARHVQLREQFDRPLSAFQVVRHELARLHARAEAATWLSRTATHTLDEVAVNAAKGWNSQASVEATAVAHQLHGAIGFTREYPLQASTKRMRHLRFAWGDERQALMRVGDLSRGTTGPAF